MGLELVRAVCAGGEASALATILQVQGSSPRHPGAKMLAGASGRLAGTVGGGRGEAMALEACRRALASGTCERLKVEMVGGDVIGTDMVCGGVTTQLIEPLGDLAPYRTALERLEAGERVLLVKRLRGGEAGPAQVEVALLDEAGRALHGRAEAAEAPAAARALDRGQAHLDPDTGVFYDPLLPQEKLLILGAGHVGQALAALAPALGFAVTVVDDRPEFLAETRLPEGVRAVHAGFAQAIAGFPFDSATYVVVVTRGHQSDLQCVRAVLGRRYRYAGFMGSARKTRLILEQMRAEGFDPDQVAALCGPIGLDIAAETPQELAVAILGEVVAVRRHAPILAALNQAREGRRA
jgi:xanthine dehydrogenase accessory factor